MSERRHPDMWVDPEDDPRMGETSAVGERATLLEYLDHYRATIEMKCDDLDAEQMARRSVPPSTMSLLGLVRHLGYVEHTWFQRVMQGRDEPKLYWSEEDHDLDFNGAVADPAVIADAWATWRREVGKSRDFMATEPSLDMTADRNGEEVVLRDVLVHMVEEYARHAGHADLLRECIDGRTGQ